MPKNTPKQQGIAALAILLLLVVTFVVGFAAVQVITAYKEANNSTKRGSKQTSEDKSNIENSPAESSKAEIKRIDLTSKNRARIDRWTVGGTGAIVEVSIPDGYEYTEEIESDSSSMEAVITSPSGLELVFDTGTALGGSCAPMTTVTLNKVVKTSTEYLVFADYSVSYDAYYDEYSGESEQYDDQPVNTDFVFLDGPELAHDSLNSLVADGIEGESRRMQCDGTINYQFGEADVRTMVRKDGAYGVSVAPDLIFQDEDFLNMIKSIKFI